jgi:multidrug efflux pump subunit AcrA (membrane-fusion protein)
MEARVFVLEADASGLAPGRTVEITLGSRPDITFPGVVGRVDALAKPLRRNVPVNYFETVVTLRPPEGLALKPGTRVRCRIDLESVDGALVVPRQAVFEKDGRPIVYRAEGDKFVPVGVKVGRYGLGTAMIEEGIREGERVALRDPAVAASEIFDKTGADQASGPKP